MMTQVASPPAEAGERKAEIADCLDVLIENGKQPVRPQALEPFQRHIEDARSKRLTQCGEFPLSNQVGADVRGDFAQQHDHAQARETHQQTERGALGD